MENIEKCLEDIWIQNYNRWKKQELLDLLSWDLGKISKSWTEKYEDMNWNILVSPILSWKKILKLLWYTADKEWIYLEIKDKEITDIWSWLWGFVFEVEKSAKKVNAVDPLYSSKGKLDILERELERARERSEEIIDNWNDKIAIIERKINEKNFQLSRQPWNYQLIFDIKDLEEEIKRQKILAEQRKKNKDKKIEVFKDMLK